MIAAGEIDLYTAPRLHSELAAVIDNAAPLTCLAQARQQDIHAGGIAELHAGHVDDNPGRRGGELELAAPRPAVMKILQVTGLDSVFTIGADPAVLPGT